MQNAYERFGRLELTRRIKDTTTHIRLRLDRLIGEIAESKEGEARAHLISVVGGDAEVAAVWAAIVEGGILYRRGTWSEDFERQSGRGSAVLSGNDRDSRTQSPPAAPGGHLCRDGKEPARG